MAGTQNSAITKLFKVLQDRYKGGLELPPANSELLDHLIFAAFYENSPVDAANEAFARMSDVFVDWNEIRICTTRELSQVIAGLPYAVRVAGRVRQSLQWLFESTYKFSLEDYRGEPSKLRELLEKNLFSTRFMKEYLLWRLTGKGPLPYDEGSLRVLRLLKLVKLNNENQEEVYNVGKVLSPQEIPLFILLLHQLGTEMMIDPDQPALMTLLASVDSGVQKRSYLSMVEVDFENDADEMARQIARQKQEQLIGRSMNGMEDYEEGDDDSEGEFIVDSENPDEGEAGAYEDSAMRGDSDESDSPKGKEKKKKKAEKPEKEKTPKVKAVKETPETSEPVPAPIEEKKPEKPVKTPKSADTQPAIEKEPSKKTPAVKSRVEKPVENSVAKPNAESQPPQKDVPSESTPKKVSVKKSSAKKGESAPKPEKASEEKAPEKPQKKPRAKKSVKVVEEPLSEPPKKVVKKAAVKKVASKKEETPEIENQPSPRTVRKEDASSAKAKEKPTKKVSKKEAKKED